MKQPERYVEPRLTQYLFDRASRTLTPLSGTFELSPVCNLACKMCYVRKTPAEVAASPRPPVGLIQWLSIAEQARDAGMLYLLLTGGEPFLWQDFWPLYERLSTMGFLISINSNGTLLDEARVARLAEHPPTRINITLYGAGNETYEALCGRSGMFDRVDRAITLLRQAGILVKLNCSLTPHNAGDLEGIVSYAAERDLILEVNTYMFPPLRRHGHGRDGKRLRHPEISVRNGLGHAHGGRAAAGRATKTNNIAFRPRQEILPGANFVVWTRIRSFRSSGHQRDCRA